MNDQNTYYSMLSLHKFKHQEQEFRFPIQLNEQRNIANRRRISSDETNVAKRDPFSVIEKIINELDRNELAIIQTSKGIGTKEILPTVEQEVVSQTIQNFIILSLLIRQIFNCFMSATFSGDSSSSCFKSVKCKWLSSTIG
uniref:Uncharacterized protein n=1 Tax=Romanomermis culicivorax TaxID=13658 RepID=A0A915IVN6_ROMCU